MWKPLLVAPALEFRGWTWREVLYSLEYSTPWREALHWRLVEE